MVQSIGSVVAGFAAWSILWIAGGAVMQALVPSAFREDGSTSSTGILLVFLGWSVALSFISGVLAARIAAQSPKIHALVLGLLLLAVGIFVQMQYWNVIPIWYHSIFLASLVPATILGGSVFDRCQQKPGA